jgi:hypothetical protein
MSTLHPLRNSLMVGLKSVRLEILDENKHFLTRASGFLVRESDGLFLYTCWHVVTGVDFLQPTPMSPPKRRGFIKLFCQNVEESKPGVQRIGDSRCVEVPIYDEAHRPRWLQEPQAQEQPDLKNIGIQVPQFFDLIRILVDLDRALSGVVAFQPDEDQPQARTDVVIVGYPYGYSAVDVTTPEPNS